MVDRFERGMAHRRQLVAEAVTAKKAREAAAPEQPAWLEPARVTSTSSPNPQQDRTSIDVAGAEALRAAIGTPQKMTARHTSSHHTRQVQPHTNAKQEKKS